MKVLKTGTLGSAVSGSGVTGASFGSGTSTPPIDLSGMGANDRVGIYLALKGNFGHSNCSLAAIWKGAYKRGGTTYTCFLRGDQSGLTGNYIVKNARTTGGFFSDGTYMKVIQPCMPWIRLEAIAVTPRSTNTATVDWAVCAF